MEQKLIAAGFILQQCTFCKIPYWSKQLEKFCFDCMKENCIEVIAHK